MAVPVAFVDPACRHHAETIAATLRGDGHEAQVFEVQGNSLEQFMASIAQRPVPCCITVLPRNLSDLTVCFRAVTPLGIFLGPIHVPISLVSAYLNRLPGSHAAKRPRLEPTEQQQRTLHLLGKLLKSVRAQRLPSPMQPAERTSVPTRSQYSVAPRLPQTASLADCKPHVSPLTTPTVEPTAVSSLQLLLEKLKAVKQQAAPDIKLETDAS
eukprot:TRINITY_DN4190_c0_g1_i1.p1 TRINITY_DN4190_c0_g1~~TRINITY_DN4190_c0_g1_i1.p1  ORF type:complete len:212 (+),score=21.77 TRINITY_DN4190_c0_g1_i1:96-731(+)